MGCCYLNSVANKCSTISKYHALFLGITVGFSSSREAFNESNALLLVCVLMYNGNLARNVSIIITSVDGTAEGNCQ